MTANSLPMNTPIYPSSDSPKTKAERSSAVRADDWKKRHWMLAMLVPALAIMVISTVGLGYCQVQGSMMTALFGCGILPLSFALPYAYWSRIAAKAEEQRRKERDEIIIKTNAIRDMEQARRDEIVQHFQHLDLKKLLLEPHLLPGEEQAVDMAALADFLLNKGLFVRVKQIIAAAQRPRAGVAPGVTLLSLALPMPLMWKLVVNEKSFCLELAAKLRAVVLSRLSPAESTGIDPQTEQQLDAAVRFEVWLLRDEALRECDWDLVFYAEKALMAHDDLVHYVVQGREPGSQGMFQAWQLPVDRAPVREMRSALLLQAEATLTALLSGRSTALRDFIAGDCIPETHLEISTLHDDPQLQARLGVHVVKQATPFPLLDSYSSTFKGTIRCVGWWDDEGWHPMAEMVRSPLSASAPNLLKKGAISVSAENSCENQLLRQLLSLPHQDFGRAVSTLGNFEIRRGPKQQGSPVFKYFIRPNPDSDTFTRILRTSGQDSFTAHQQKSRYEEIGSNLTSLQPSPLEQRGFYRLPFSEGYLMTGDATLQICLHLDLGSPSLGEGAEMPLLLDDETLPGSLQAFALENGVQEQDYELLESNTAQGLTARAVLPKVGACYLKLLEAAHTRKYGTVIMLDRLMAAGILPRSIRHQRINSRGRASDRGELHVFITPACRSVASALREEELTFDQRLACWAELNRFCLRLREKSVACTDITLSDLMFESPSLAEALTLVEEKADGPALFVVDYGSYIRHLDFKRESVIVKEEMCAPEDWELSLPYEPEAYQVFLQGLLAVQILLADPGYVPAAILRQRERASLAEMQRELWAELNPRLCPLLEGHDQGVVILDMLRRMLSAHPQQRPTLKTIAG